MKKPEEDLQKHTLTNKFLIVGIGASAGGIQALTSFFGNVPAISGAAYVVILHLSPDHNSQLTQVLQTVAKIPVTQIIKKTKVQPDNIYVISPDKHLVMEDGHVSVLPNLNIEERRAPVDIFFRTLAESHGPQAVCVVLSGTGANGSMGLKRVKECGGAAFVQNPREAAFNEMPRNSIATGLVDDILDVAAIPARICTYRDTLIDAHIEEDPEQRIEEDQQALRELFTQLRIRTGHDFSNYKRATLIRRIERRMAVHTLAALPAYVAYANEHPEETQALLKDLLISVTNFFRDKTPFTVLEEKILPEIFESKKSEEQVRIWIAGCATGEEAYSIAMLCAERTMGIIEAPKVQIFATDIDEAAIAAAREGFYTLNDAADISSERLSRFFTKEDNGYRIRREIRETVLFAHHNFLKDPPFSRIDLISCRNVLIYLNRPAQDRVMETFHFAMKPEGYLLLGTSENVDAASDLFRPVNREQHIYQARISTTLRTIVVPETVSQLRILQPVQPTETKTRSGSRIPYGDVHLKLLEQYGPPSLVVDPAFNLVHVSSRAGRYLEIAGGEPTQAVLKLIREDLHVVLRNALYQAAQSGVPVNSPAISIRTVNGMEDLQIHVQPMIDESEVAPGYLLVVFEPAMAASDHRISFSSHNDESIARHLEDELSRMRAQLRMSNEQHEFQAEELKAGNEELQAMNEELRSATEELETSKEELQSINEELGTVNQELKVRVEEATLVGDNLQNLINATDIGTIFLDRSFRVMLFTPAARSVYNLIPADYGRPLSDITSKLEENTVLEDAQQVLERLQRIEREVSVKDGRMLFIRISPYRSEEDRIMGVVIAMLDITERKLAEQVLRDTETSYRVKLEEEVQQRTAELEESKNLLQATMDASMDMIQVFKAVRNEQGEIIDFIWILNNHASDIVYGDVVGKSLLTLNPGVIETGIFNTFKAVVETGIPHQSERHYTHEQFDGWFYQSAVKLGDGVATTTSDITIRKKAELELQQGKTMLQSIIDAPNIGIAVYKAVRNDSGGIIDFVHDYINRASTDMLGGEDFTGRSLSDHGDNGRSQIHQFIEALETGQGNNYMKEVQFRGRYAWFSLSNTPLDRDRLVHTWEDVTERKKVEQEIKEQAHFIQSVTDTTPAIISITSYPDGRTIFNNRDPFGALGFDTDELVQMNPMDRLELVHPDDVDKLKNYYTLFPSLTDGDEVRIEYRIKNKKDEWTWLDTRGKVFMRNAEGEPEQILHIAQNITEQKRAEQEILDLKDEIAEKAEEKYRTLFETIDEGFCIMELVRDERGDVIDVIYREVNNAFERHTGLSSIVGRRSTETIPNYDPDRFKLYQHLSETGEKSHMEIYVNDLGRWLRVHHMRMGTAGSNLIAAVFEDVTARKQREQQREFLLRLSDDLRPLTDAEEIRSIASKVLGQHLGANRVAYAENIEEEASFKVANNYVDGAENITGLFKYTNYGSDLLSNLMTGNLRVQPDIQNDPRLSEPEKQALALVGVGASLNVPLVKNGRLVAFLGINYSSAHAFSEFEIELAREVAERTWDAVARANTEEALRESEERLVLAVEIGEMASWDWNLYTDTVTWNDRHFIIQGYQPGEITPGFDAWLARVHPDDRTETVSLIEQARDNKQIYSHEFRTLHPDGVIRWCTARGRFFYDAAGQPYRMIGVMEDITDRKLAEIALRENDERQARLLRLRDEFIGIASHELNTPVTSMKVYAEIVRERMEELGDINDVALLSKLNVQIDRLRSLIVTLLDTTRIAEGKLQLRLEATDINELIRERIEEIGRTSNHKIELLLQPLPVVAADQERIGQVIINLLSNAVKYSPKETSITVSTASKAGLIKVSVQDHGYGIPENDVPKVFDRFFRVTANKMDTYPGMGLGLYISAQIVERHGGRISVQSQEGIGSTFSFSLPIENSTSL